MQQLVWLPPLAITASEHSCEVSHHMVSMLSMHMHAEQMLCHVSSRQWPSLISLAVPTLIFVKEGAEVY